MIGRAPATLYQKKRFLVHPACLINPKFHCLAKYFIFYQFFQQLGGALIALTKNK